MANTITSAVASSEEAALDIQRKLVEQGALSKALAPLRSEAAARFESLGLPGKKHEMFTFADMRRAASLIGAGPRLSPGEADAGFIRDNIYAGLEKSVIVIVDGFLNEKLTNLDGVSGAVKIKSLGGAFGEAGVGRYLTSSAKCENDAFAALNAAFLADGVILDVAPGARLETPLQILNVSTAPSGAAAMASPRIFIRVGEGADCAVIIKSAGEGGYLSNTVTDVILNGASSLRLWAVQADGAEAVSLSKTRATISGGARLDAALAQNGCALARHHFEARLSEPGARLGLSGVAVLSNDEQAHNYVRVVHEAPECVSEQLFRNIVGGRARASVDGTVVVNPGAQLTESNQLINNLMLSGEARADTKPNLMIYADDVKCSHGATVGRVDEEQVFYLRTRNFTEKAAKALLTASFARSVMDKIGYPAAREEVEKLLLGKLEG